MAKRHQFLWKKTAAITASMTLAGIAAPMAAHASSTVKAQRGGTLNVAAIQDIVTLDPANTGQVQWLYDENVFSTLTDNNSKDVPQPNLATSWTMSKNSKQIVFDLRHGVRFQNGNAFTSADVKFSIERLLSSQVKLLPGNASKLADWAKDVASIQTPSPYRVIINLNQPEPYIFDFFDNLYIVDQKALHGNTAITTVSEAVGTGPFALKSWTPGQSMVLQRNRYYFVKGEPYLNGVQVNIVPNAETAYLQLQAGQADFVANLPSADVAALRKSHPAQVVVGCPVNFYFIGSNTTKPPLNNRYVREAINHAIDRRRFVSQILQNQGEPITQVWTPYSPFYLPKLDAQMQFSLKTARELMKKAGVSHASVELQVNANQPPLAELAQIMQADLAKIGITLTIQTIPAAQYQQEAAKGDFPGLFAGPTGNPCEPPIDVLSNQQMNPLGNSMSFTSSIYRSLFSQLQHTTNPVALKKIDKKLTGFLLNTSFIMPVATQVSAFALGANVRGFTGNRRNGGWPLGGVWLKG